MKIILANIVLFEYKKGLILPKRKKMDTLYQISYSHPIGLLYIGRSIEDEGHSAEIIDLYFEKNPIEAIKKSLDSADVIGLNAYTPTYKNTAYIAKLIKESRPDLPVIIGGPHCTLQLEKSLVDIPDANVAVIGEGEQIIKDVIKGFEGKKQWSEIPGIYYRENGIIKKGKPPKLIKDLDSIAFPLRHLIDKYEYGKIYNIYFYKPRYTSISTSRGCPFHCRFCIRDALFDKNYRKRSVGSVVEEFKEINDNFRSVLIVDDNFLADKKRAQQIFERLIESGIDLELSIAGARVDTADEELYKKMKKAGVKHIFYGIESGNQDVLDYYKKETNLNMIRNTVKLAHKMSFFTTGSFILGAPIETKTHIKKSIEFANSLPLDFILWRPLKYRYGSDIWDKAVAEGKISEDEDCEIVADSRKGLGIFTKEELEKFCNIANRKFYLRPQYIFQETSKMIMKRDLTILKIVINGILS